MNRADIFVYYDVVQFVRRSWHCRTYITDRGVARWLSAPVRTADGSRHPLSVMQWADDQPWRTKMARRLKQHYAISEEPHLLKEVLHLIEKGSSSLVDWNIAANALIGAALNIKTPTLKSSELTPITGNKQQRIIRLCRELGATKYLCGPASRSYIQDRDFAESGITVEWLNYDYEFRAMTTSGVDIFPSMIDLILLKGLNAARNEIVRKR